MVKIVVVGRAEHNDTVEKLKGMSSKIGYKVYLDMDTGDIVQIADEEKKAEVPKKMARKKRK